MSQISLRTLRLISVLTRLSHFENPFKKQYFQALNLKYNPYFSLAQNLLTSGGALNELQEVGLLMEELKG